MQPIELKLALHPNDASAPRCSAFVMLAPRSGCMITNLLALIACHPEYQTGKRFLLPTNDRDLSASGIVWFRESDDLVKCPVGAIPLRPVTLGKKLSGSVWIPCGSRLEPKIEPGTLSSQLSGDALIRVWLPSVGLVGFGTGDQLQPHDWLSAPICSESPAWVTPPETWSPPHSIIELGMLCPPTAESFLEDIRQEIGLPPGSLLETDDDGTNETKPSPAAQVKDWLLKKLDAMAGHSKRDVDSSGHDTKPMSDTSPTGKSAAQGGGVGSLAAPLVAAMSRMLQGERDRQIQKLLRMFESNPDAALKYAIPVGGISNAFRGFRMPGAALLERLTDFSLFGISGGAGQSVDLWSIDPGLQNRLQERYRAQANRELVAGRYRRAAYIFAQLLSDFRGAAEALEKGRFYAEAAVIYRDHLHDKKKSAACFAKGGMHREACELYVAMKLYETAGEVLLEAGLETEARNMFQEALNEQIRKGEVISAAKILDQRLGQRSDAIQILCNQWPDGGDALPASELAIEWLGQDGLHDQTLKLMDKMSDEASERNYDQFAYLSQGATNTYPDHRVRTAAEDHCRLAVARALRSNHSPQVRRAVLATLTSLDSHDKQLRRDSQRYVRWGESKKPVGAGKSNGRQWTRLAELCLQSGVHYVDFRVEKGQLFALSMRDDRIFLTHMPQPESESDVNTTRSAKLPRGNAKLTRPDAFIKFIDFKLPGLVRAVACAPKASDTLLRANHVSAQPSPLLLIENDPMVLASVDASPTDIWELQRLDPNLVLRHSGGHTFDLTKSWAEFWQVFGKADSGDSCEKIALAVVNGDPIVALDHILLMPRNGEIERIASFDERVWALAGSLPKTRARVVVAHCSGLEVVNLDTFEVVNVCRQRGYSLCQWAPNGKLVAWSDGELHCFESGGGSYRRVAETRTGPGRTPAGLVSLSSSVIGVTYAYGRISRYRLPR